MKLRSARIGFVPVAIALAALALLLTVGGPAAAQKIKKDAVDTALTGKVVAVQAKGSKLSIREATGKKRLIKVDDDTTIMSGDAHVALGALKKGDWVAVDAHRKGQSLVATYIEVVVDPSPPAVSAGKKMKQDVKKGMKEAEENVEDASETYEETYEEDRAAGEGMVEAGGDAYDAVREKGK